MDNLNRLCPEQKVKVGSQDKAWINSDLKKIHRLKSREYNRNGKSEKYVKLAKEFKTKYKIEAAKYMEKNVAALMDTNPGQAYKVLKRMGAQPGDCQDSNSFSLPSHTENNLTNQECAERMAEHFAAISNTFLPLSVHLLPVRVQSKLESEDCQPPVITAEETWQTISAAKKPHSCVPGDLPRDIIKEHSVEIATPLSKVMNTIMKTAKWPTRWKKEYITPIGKISEPETEDDLRPISLTPFFSKVTERFVVKWLLEYIGPLIDFRQYGGMKGNSITHYLIEFVNFILSNQENTEPTAILACLIDFSKAFNRQNHNILITKLSDMGVPAWLLRIVMSFLSDRTMVVRYKGATSSEKKLPGGGPQGTLLGLLLFIVLINDIGFSNQMNNAGELITTKRTLRSANQLHLKFVDDLTLAESLILKESVLSVPESARPQPDPYRARTGHVLVPGNSQVLSQITSVIEYAKENDMKLNLDKTKFMLFNHCQSIDFQPSYTIDGTEIEYVEETKLLGLVLTSDLKFDRNTEFIVKKGYKRIWILKRLKNLGASIKQLIDVYVKQIRSVLELSVPVWHSSLTLANRLSIERVQKAALQVILGSSYISYTSARKLTDLLTLETRRVNLCHKFALKTVKNLKHKKWFKVNNRISKTRRKQPAFCHVISRTKRFENSPISYLTQLLNNIK